MAIIGIDLGTTNSLVSVYRNGHAELLPNEWGEFMTPSCVGVLEDGTVTVGAVAKERLITHPEETAASFKTWMGTQKEYILGGRRFLPQELSALVLRKLAQNAREALGEEIEEAIISVPAYFNDNQRCATRLAAQLAGLPVKRLINEPSAAALYYSQSRAQSECRLLVIDFGGGTLDVSVVDCFENMVEIVAIAGNNHLGGNDIDQAIAGYFCGQTGLVWSAVWTPSSSGSFWLWRNGARPPFPVPGTAAACWPVRSARSFTVCRWTPISCLRSASRYSRRCGR